MNAPRRRQTLGVEAQPELEPPKTGGPRRGIGKSRGGWRPQFGLFTLLAIMTLLSVPFALWGGLLREGAKPDQGPRLMFFVVMAIASPMLVMIVISAVKPIRRWWRNRRQKAEEGRQKAEGRGQKDEGERQKAEGRRQKDEGERQKAEGRGQKDE